MWFGTVVVLSSSLQVVESAAERSSLWNGVLVVQINPPKYKYEELVTQEYELVTQVKPATRC